MGRGRSRGGDAHRSDPAVPVSPTPAGKHTLKAFPPAVGTQNVSTLASGFPWLRGRGDGDITLSSLGPVGTGAGRRLPRHLCSPRQRLSPSPRRGGHRGAFLGIRLPGTCRSVPAGRTVTMH